MVDFALAWATLSLFADLFGLCSGRPCPTRCNKGRLACYPPYQSMSSLRRPWFWPGSGKRIVSSWTGLLKLSFRDDRSSQMTDRKTGIGSWTSF